MKLTEKAARTTGVIGWLLGAQAMVAVGSVGGPLGCWAAGGGLYAIMAHEWEGAGYRQKKIRQHLTVTAAAALCGFAAELTAFTSGAAPLLNWEQLPLITVLLGACHNWRHAPHVDQKRFTRDGARRGQHEPDAKTS